MNTLYTVFFLFMINNYRCYGFYNKFKLNNLSFYKYKNIKNNNQYLYSKNIEYKLIYNRYEKFALKKAIEFKNKYKINLKNNQEIYMYSKIGLHKAIINYNFTPNFNMTFYNYLQKYIYGELYNYISDKHSLSSIPRYMRKKNIYNKYKKSYPLLIHNYWYFDKIYNNYNDKHSNHNDININEIWQLINNNLDSNSLLIFKNKYDYNFNVIRSNLDISRSFGYSEEYIRLNLNKSKDIIKKILEER
jgi:hypothetical protein